MCIKYISSKVDYQLGRCSCGKYFVEHDEIVQRASNTEMKFLTVQKEERWTVQKHTRCDPTDAFGTIEFEGMAHPTKALCAENVNNDQWFMDKLMKCLRSIFFTKPVVNIKW